jgi:hypothetical protein
MSSNTPPQNTSLAVQSTGNSQKQSFAWFAIAASFLFVVYAFYKLFSVDLVQQPIGPPTVVHHRAAGIVLVVVAVSFLVTSALLMVCLKLHPETEYTGIAPDRVGRLRVESDYTGIPADRILRLHAHPETQHGAEGYFRADRQGTYRWPDVLRLNPFKNSPTPYANLPTATSA